MSSFSHRSGYYKELSEERLSYRSIRQSSRSEEAWERYTAGVFRRAMKVAAIVFLIGIITLIIGILNK